MNSEVCKQALEIVKNPNVLVNIISRRVRQLTSGGRPLLAETAGLGWADIALLEIVEGKMNFELLESENGHGGKPFVVKNPVVPRKKPLPLAA